MPLPTHSSTHTPPSSGAPIILMKSIVCVESTHYLKRHPALIHLTSPKGSETPQTTHQKLKHLTTPTPYNIMKTQILLSLAYALNFANSISLAADPSNVPVPRTVVPVVTAAEQARITPDQALQRLLTGNQRFSTGNSIRRDLRRQVVDSSSGQAPFASVLSCIDSRSGPETVFDQGIGDIFTARLAGNIVDNDVLGSLEFGAEEAGSKLVVVLGHAACGAVRATADHLELEHVTGLLNHIDPPLRATVTRPGEDRSSANGPFIQRVVEENTRYQLAQIRLRSRTLRRLEEEGKIKMVAAVYDIHTGKVSVLSEQYPIGQYHHNLPAVFNTKVELKSEVKTPSTAPTTAPASRTPARS
jgi:carbonic anhydrase